MNELIKNIGVIIVVLTMVLTIAFIGYSIRDCPKCEECEDCPDCPTCPEVSVYDVDRNGVVNINDVNKAWSYISNNHYPLPFPDSMDAHPYSDYLSFKAVNYYAEKLYDVNGDKIANWEDVELIWENMD